jgi:hypothetical protein
MNTERGREQIEELFRFYFPDKIPPVPSLMIEMIADRQSRKSPQR